MQRPTPLSVLGTAVCIGALALVWISFGDGGGGGGGGDPPSPPSIVETLRKLVPELQFTDKQWNDLADTHGNTAINVAKEFGKNGVLALLHLGTPAVAVMRENPEAFREISKRLDGP
ncbi:MAG: hypothetical protein FJ267_17470, partial [Planctomycetes bacterium]|nr:hypothetical protein [Planctomycetota bacterium]